MTTTRRAIYTIGHSTRALQELIDLLKSHEIALLADVRTIPRSRFNPQFNREMLPEDLKLAGIEYRHIPGLGGLRSSPLESSPNTGWHTKGFRNYADYMLTPLFAESLDELIALALVVRTAIMCAEAVPWRCHRSLIADALTVRGLQVFHIVAPGRLHEHVITPFAHRCGATLTYPSQAEAGGVAKESR